MYILVVIRLNNLPEGNEHDTNSNGLDTQDRSRDMSRQLASCHGDVQAVPVPGKLYLSYTSLNYNLYIYIYTWVINHLLGGMYIQVGAQTRKRPSVLRGFHAAACCFMHHDPSDASDPSSGLRKITADGELLNWRIPKDP